MSRQSYEAWTEAARAGTYTPLCDSRLLEAWQWSQIHGNANSWTGQTGVASVFIRELLRERLRLLDMIAEMAADDEALRDEEFGPQAEVVK